MSSLSFAEKQLLEHAFEMGGGYVLNFSDRTFEEFGRGIAGIDASDPRYTAQGTSKAKRLRGIWAAESDAIVGRLTAAMIDILEGLPEAYRVATGADIAKCRAIANRLLAGGPALADLKATAARLDARHLAEQIARMEGAVAGDPGLAIGTAKELIETTCRTILEERGITVTGKPDVSDLTKLVFEELDLIPSGVPDSAKGASSTKRVLGNLATIGVHIAELRNLYGTGHGKEGRAGGLGARHAKLAVGASATLCRFLFETHEETKGRPSV